MPKTLILTKRVWNGKYRGIWRAKIAPTFAGGFASHETLSDMKKMANPRSIRPIGLYVMTRDR